MVDDEDHQIYDDEGFDAQDEERRLEQEFGEERSDVSSDEDDTSATTNGGVPDMTKTMYQEKLRQLNKDLKRMKERHDELTNKI